MRDTCTNSAVACCLCLPGLLRHPSDQLIYSSSSTLPSDSRSRKEHWRSPPPTESTDKACCCSTRPIQKPYIIISKGQPTKVLDHPNQVTNSILLAASTKYYSREKWNRVNWTSLAECNYARGFCCHDAASPNQHKKLLQIYYQRHLLSSAE